VVVVSAITNENMDELLICIPASVGQYAIQIASMHGFNIITTCSPRNFDLVKKLGATHVFDYNDSNVVDNIKKAAPDLEYTFDTIGAGDSSAQASQAIASKGGVLCTVRPGKANTENVAQHVKVTDVLVWTAFLKDHQYKDFHWPVSHLCVQHVKVKTNTDYF
jgi:NADPH:quinone reductase-like Zn-dependent oxidoreductase